MVQARTLWHDGMYEESAEAMVSVSTFDAPPQVCLLPVVHCCLAACVASCTICSAIQAQHNKLLAEFTAQDRKDPQKLLAALEALDQVSHASTGLHLTAHVYCADLWNSAESATAKSRTKHPVRQQRIPCVEVEYGEKCLISLTTLLVV